MMPVWPAELPRPLRDAFGARRQQARRRSNTQSGPIRLRRTFSSVAREVSLGIEVTPDQALIFEDFFAVTLNEGTRYFRAPDFAVDAFPICTAAGNPLLTAIGVPLTINRTCTWLFGDEPPSEGPFKGFLRTITFTLLRMP